MEETSKIVHHKGFDLLSVVVNINSWLLADQRDVNVAHTIPARSLTRI